MLCTPVFGDQNQNAAMVERLNAGVVIPSPFAPARARNMDHVSAEQFRYKLHDLQTRWDSIQTSVKSIQEKMRKQHKYLHGQAFYDIEQYVVAQQQETVQRNPAVV